MKTANAPPESSLPCDVCDAADSEELSLRERDGGYLRTVICRRCGLVYSDPRPEPDEVREFYEHSYRLQYKATYQPKPKHVYRAAKVALDRVRRLSHLLTPHMSVLDFGAGGGELVYALRAMGLKAAGFEPNEGYARFASDVLGLPVSHAFYQNARVEAGSHELVTMFHVLEHLEHPCEALRHVREWLRPQGLLFVEVPNIEAICQWPGSVFHRAHLYNFSPAALKMAGQRAGYAIVSSDISADGGNISVVLQKADSPIAGSGQIPGNYERVRSILRRHTAFRHLLSPFPYIRPLRKLAANLEERRAVKKDLSPNAILDRVTSLQAAWQSASTSKAGHCPPAL